MATAFNLQPPRLVSDPKHRPVPSSRTVKLHQRPSPVHRCPSLPSGFPPSVPTPRKPTRPCGVCFTATLSSLKCRVSLSAHFLQLHLTGLRCLSLPRKRSNGKCRPMERHSTCPHAHLPQKLPRKRATVDIIQTRWTCRSQDRNDIDPWETYPWLDQGHSWIEPASRKIRGSIDRIYRRCCRASTPE